MAKRARESEASTDTVERAPARLTAAARRPGLRMAAPTASRIGDAGARLEGVRIWPG
jgi:hypothetical protein